MVLEIKYTENARFSKGCENTISQKEELCNIHGMILSSMLPPAPTAR